MRRFQFRQRGQGRGRWGRSPSVTAGGSPLTTGVVAAVALAAAGCVPTFEAEADDAAPDSDFDIEFGVEDGEDGDSGTGVPIDERPERPAPDGSRPATVVRVVDGDSIEVSIDGEEIDIRLQNYNAPEKFDDAGDESCNGAASTEALSVLVDAGSEVQVVGTETDRFGRTLADLYVDGWSVTESLVAGGHGMATRDRTDWRALMKDAAADGLGIWGPRCGDVLTTDLRLGDIQANPPGPDEDVLEDEWVEIVNRSDDTIDLDGWVLRDDTTSHRFTLDGSLGPDDVLRVRTGNGNSSGNDRYLGEDFPVWSNSNETVLLIDPFGVVTDWAFVDGRG